jgi:hypothetical protein
VAESCLRPRSNGHGWSGASAEEPEMNERILPAAFASFAAICGLLMAPMAKAATTTIPGSACQLSIPTTDTKFRPKATGARNESTTTSNFVICPIASPNAANPAIGQGFGAINIQLVSIDDASRSFTCTAVAGGDGSSPMYSTKSAAMAAGASFYWDAGDFGGTSGDMFIPFGTFMTITCLLSPQTAVKFANGAYAIP